MIDRKRLAEKYEKQRQEQIKLFGKKYVMHPDYRLADNPNHVKWGVMASTTQRRRF